jgi:uncharacterized protein (DUF2267 family)
MPMPWTYRHASAEWQRFLDVAKDEMNLVSNNAAYTAIQGVLLTFRRRLTIDQGLRFSDALPSIPRSVFVMGWHPAPPLPWGNRDEQTAEAQALRPHHNLTPPNCIEATAIALRALVRPDEIDPVLAAIGPGAEAFWWVDPARIRQVDFP